MNYSNYYEICKQQYEKEGKPPRDSEKEKEFYENPVREFDFMSSTDYREAVESLSHKVKSDFDTNTDTLDDKIMLKHTNIWKFSEEIRNLCNVCVPKLESSMYFCNLYVDKIYIYRTNSLKDRESSYIWHYDNNPLEVVKTIIYLTDVDNEENSPYEYLIDSNNRGVIHPPTRTGPSHWLPAPNNSRVNNIVEALNKTTKPISNKVLGKKGTSCTFNNNAIHRANPLKKGFRDVINIRVKPTLIRPAHFADPKWTTGFEISGVVNPDPTLAWTSLV